VYGEGHVDRRRQHDWHASGFSHRPNPSQRRIGWFRRGLSECSRQGGEDGARLLYRLAPAALLFTMAGERFGYCEGLSETVAAALPGMLAAVRRAAGG
jgi:hypothetical protein